MSKSSISCTFLLIHLFILKGLREVFYTLSLFFQYFSLCYIRGFKLSYSEISTTAPTNIMWSEFFPVWQFYTALMVKFSIIRHAIIYLDETFNALWIIERKYVLHSMFSFILFIHSLKRVQQQHGLLALQILTMTTENLCIDFERKLTSDLLVYFSSSHKFSFLDDFISCLSRYFGMNYKLQIDRLSIG